MDGKRGVCHTYKLFLGIWRARAMSRYWMASSWSNSKPTAIGLHASARETTKVEFAFGMAGVKTKIIQSAAWVFFIPGKIARIRIFESAWVYGSSALCGA